MSKSNKVKKYQKINEKVMIVGIDIGKETNTGYWRYPGRAESKVFSFGNNLAGFKFFWDKITKARIVHRAEKIRAGIESTGSYGVPLLAYLGEKPVELVQVNPMHTKRLKDVRGNSRTKSDKKDPLVIADIIQLGNYLQVIMPRGASAHLRHLIHSRERILVKLNVSTNQLQDLIFKIFPEFLSIMKGVQSKSALYLLKNHPTPEALIELGFENLVLLLKKISRGKLDFDRALELYKAAKCSVGIQSGRESILMEIDYLLEEIASYTAFIEKLEEKIASYLSKIPYSRYMLSIKGIGNIIVAGIIGEVGHFGDYRNHFSLIKLAGLNLCERRSGKYKGKIKISKQGRALLRKLLFFAALNVVKKDGILYEYYQSLINRGMIENKALTAVSRKLLKILFALVRNKRNYIPYHEVKLAA